MMEDPKEDQPMEEEKKSEGLGFGAFGKESEKSEGISEPRFKDELQTCCCCLCACSNVKTADESCCGCFPLKCGVVTIGGILLTLTTFLITYNFFLILNDYFAWYYPVVTLVLYAPLIVACNFYVLFFTKDKNSTRAKLFVACMLTIISVVLASIWSFCYIYYLYKQDVVYEGINDPSENHYIHYTKKFYVFMKIAYAVVIVIFFAYFLTVTSRYHTVMKPQFLLDKEAMEEAEAREKSEKAKMMK